MSDLAREVWYRYTWLRDNGHNDFVAKAKTCLDYFFGQQWKPEDLFFLESVNRPALTINKILSTVSNIRGEQIFNRTDTAFRPRNEDATSAVADVLTKVFMQISDNNQLPWIRSSVFLDGLITSRGFFDARLDFTDSLRGEVRITQLNPKNVLIDDGADSYDPDGWSDVIYSKWLNPNLIELIYSKEAAKELRSRNGVSAVWGYDSLDFEKDRFGTQLVPFQGNPTMPDRDIARDIRVLERQYRKLSKVEHFVDITNGDLRPVPSEWERNQIAEYLRHSPDISVTSKLINRIRWTVVADDIELHDDWSPYSRFTVIPYFPCFIRGRTLGVVENLIGPQELLNKASSQELHVINTTANSGWKLEQGALTNMTVGELENRGATTGLVLELTDIGKAEKIQPNQIPSGLDRITFKAEEHIKTISGVSDYQLGSAREDVAAKSVIANKQSGSVNQASIMDALVRTDYMLVRHILDMVQAYYTERRLMHITADKLRGSTETLVVNDVGPEGQIVNDLTLGEYSVVISNQPERDVFEDSQFDQAVQLKKDLGIAIPDRFVIGASRLQNKEEIVKAMEGDQESPEAQRQRQIAVEMQQAELDKLRAEAMRDKADAQLKMAKGQEQAQPVDQEALQRLELERQRIELEFKLKQLELDRNFALKKQELEMKREQARVQSVPKE